MTGSASRVAVCIGRKNATALRRAHRVLAQPLLREIGADDVEPRRASDAAGDASPNGCRPRS